MRDSKHWLDVLTNGQILRDWLSLNAHFFLSLAYWTVGLTLFAVGLGLSIILVGLPLLLFALVATRKLAQIDRQVMGALLDVETPDMAEDVDARGANLGERLGMYAGSATTWRSFVYLALKLPLGVMTFMAAWLILPLLAFEVLILAPLTIDMRLLSARLLHWFAVGVHRGSGLLLPSASGKRKRDRLSRLETVEEAEPRYYIDEEGEIATYKRFS